eukprot:GHVP01029823.1.p1 GENE.GHVP01029823.1~~GHVP01029823.1.p1  ORF type:complete len:691 (+),score=125.84 GHVP01029823.1:1303-3375(+)
MRKNFVSCAESLIDSGSDVNFVSTETGYSLLGVALFQGNKEIGRALLEKRCILSSGLSQVSPPLILAVAALDMQAVTMMCEQNPDVVNSKDVEGNTSLHVLMTSFNDRPEESALMMHLLVANGINSNELNSAKWAPIHLAVKHGQNLAISKLIEFNKKYKELCAKPLKNPPQKNLSMKFDVNEPKISDLFDLDIRGGECWWAPIHIAVYQEDIKVISLLLDAGCDAQVVTKYGKTARQISQGSPIISKIIQTAEISQGWYRCVNEGFRCRMKREVNIFNNFVLSYFPFKRFKTGKVLELDLENSQEDADAISKKDSDAISSTCLSRVPRGISFFELDYIQDLLKINLNAAQLSPLDLPWPVIWMRFCYAKKHNEVERLLWSWHPGAIRENEMDYLPPIPGKFLHSISKNANFDLLQIAGHFLADDFCLLSKLRTSGGDSLINLVSSAKRTDLCAVSTKRMIQIPIKYDTLRIQEISNLSARNEDLTTSNEWSLVRVQYPYTRSDILVYLFSNSKCAWDLHYSEAKPPLAIATAQDDLESLQVILLQEIQQFSHLSLDHFLLAFDLAIKSRLFIVLIQLVLFAKSSGLFKAILDSNQETLKFLAEICKLSETKKPGAPLITTDCWLCGKVVYRIESCMLCSFTICQSCVLDVSPNAAKSIIDLKNQANNSVQRRFGRKSNPKKKVYSCSFG